MTAGNTESFWTTVVLKYFTHFGDRFSFIYLLAMNWIFQMRRAFIICTKESLFLSHIKIKLRCKSEIVNHWTLSNQNQLSCIDSVSPAPRKKCRLTRKTTLLFEKMNYAGTKRKHWSIDTNRKADKKKQTNVIQNEFFLHTVRKIFLLKAVTLNYLIKY